MKPTHTPLAGALSFRPLPDLFTFGSGVTIHAGTYIAIDGKPVGIITPPNPRTGSGWGIALYLVDPSDKLGWRLSQLRVEFSTESDARQAYKMGDASLRSQFHLHQIETEKGGESTPEGSLAAVRRIFGDRG